MAEVTTDSVLQEKPQTEYEAPLYEVGYIVVPTLGEEAVSEAVSTLHKSLEKHGAGVFSEEFPARRALAYEMIREIGGANQRFSEGYFGWVKFTAESDAIAGLEDDLSRNESVVRFLITEATRAEMIPVRQRLASARVPETKRRVRTVSPEAPKPTIKEETGMDDAELDKTIEDLVIE